MGLDGLDWISPGGVNYRAPLLYLKVKISHIFQAMGALASSDSGGSSIQNKLGIAATTLSPEELLHQQKVFTRFLEFLPC